MKLLFSFSIFFILILSCKSTQVTIPIYNIPNDYTSGRYEKDMDNNFNPYEGTWINITTRLTLEPHASLDWEYAVAHAQWQGLPASSAAQLSLVGWGFNGFWTQMALGSWGETLCLQPGRTMRRAFETMGAAYTIFWQVCRVEAVGWRVEGGGLSLGSGV